MKKLSTLVFAAILIISQYLNSQTGLLVTDYDYSNYPEVTFDYYVFQNSINQNGVLNSNDFIILNNDINITEKSIECFGNTKTENNSVIASIDLSIDNSSFLFDSVKSNLNTLQLSTTNAEFALSSFNTVNHLNFDFNQSYSSFKTELNRLILSEKSKIDSTFYSMPIGSNIIFENANPSNVKHIIVFTDKNEPINIEHLIRLSAENINLYIVVLNNEADNETVTYFDTKSNFYLFQNVTHQNLRLVTSALREIISGIKPCKLTFNADLDCDTNIRTNIAVPTVSDNEDFVFSIPKSTVARLELNPAFYGFSSVLPNEKKQADIVITAVNSDINIDSIYFEDDKGGIFTILSGKISSPQILQQGSNWEIEIEYAPVDSNIVFTKLIVVSDACFNEEILITGGFPNTPPVVKNIEIENPNKCDEVLIVGDKYRVEWTGLLPSDVIQLEYSTDNGVTWDTLASNVTDLGYEWIVPDLESEECLVRAIQLWPNNIGRTLDLVHPEAVNTAFFDHLDGSKAVTSCDDGVVRLWNTNTGKLIRTYVAHTKEVNYAVLSSDDRKIASSSNDTNVILWDINDGSTPLHIFREHNDVVRSVNFSIDNKKIITVDKSGVCKLFDVENYTELHSFNPDGNRPLWYADFHPNGNYYLTGGNGGSVKVWDISTNDFVKEFKITGWVNQFALNKDGSRILIVDILNKVATVWDFETGQELFTLEHKFQPNLPLNSGSFTEIDGQEYMLTSGDDNTAIMWNSIGDSISVYREHTSSVRTAMFNFDGQRVITSSWDKTAKVWNLNERDLQMDTSDCAFTITKLNYEKNDLAFGNVILGDYKDSTLSDAIINLNKFQFPIRNAFLRGANVDDFIIQTELINTIVDTLAINNSRDIKVRFNPTALGERSADLVLDVPGNEVVIKLTGNSTKRDLEVVQDYILFDKVDIGDFRDKVIEIAVRNNSGKDLTFDSIYIDIPRNNDYSLIMENEITELKAGRDLGITARFAPQFIDRSNADIVFVHNGNNSPTRISLLGTGALPVFDTTTVSISDIEANSGNTVKAVISITTLKPELNNEEFKGISFDLSFNSTLLHPNFSYTSDNIENGVRTISVEMEANNSWYSSDENKTNSTQAGEINIGELEFSTALGNDSTTTLNLNNSKVVGKAKLKINETDGTFRLLDLCEEGGTRFFDASDRFSLETIAPNPIINSIYINYELLEESQITLSVSDYLGNKVLELENGKSSIGTHTAYLDINMLPNGVYFIKLETQNQSLIRKIQISK